MSLMNSTASMVMILSDMSKRDKMGKNKISYIENAAYCNFVIQNESTNALQIKSLILIMPEIIKSELTPRQSEILDLIIFKGLTQTQVANVLGLSQPTIHSSYNAAILKLRKYLYFCNECIKKYSQLKEAEENDKS